MINKKTFPTFDELLEFNPQLKQIIFDMDGTLINTEPLHAEVVISMLKLDQNKDLASNQEKSEQLKKQAEGLADTLLYDFLNEHQLVKGYTKESFIQEKNERIIEMINDGAMQGLILDGVEKIFKEAQKQNISMALVTSSEKAITECTLKILNWNQYFNLVVTREDTKDNKPHPAPYLKVYDDLKLKKDDSIILEDSSCGLEAAERSGCPFIIKALWYK